MPKINYGKHVGLEGPRRFKIYQEPHEVTLFRIIEYLENYGTATYASRLLDKLLLDVYPHMIRDEVKEKEFDGKHGKIGKLIDVPA